MSQTVEEKLKNLEELANAATSGNWMLTTGKAEYPDGIKTDAPGAHAIINWGAIPKPWNETWHRNSDYICAANPKEILGLITALRAANSYNLSLRQLLKEYREHRGRRDHARDCILDVTEGDESDDCCSICRKYDALESK